MCIIYVCIYIYTYVYMLQGLSGVWVLPAYNSYQLLARNCAKLCMVKCLQPAARELHVSRFRRTMCIPLKGITARWKMPREMFHRFRLRVNTSGRFFRMADDGWWIRRNRQPDLPDLPGRPDWSERTCIAIGALALVVVVVFPGVSGLGISEKIWGQTRWSIEPDSLL